MKRVSVRASSFGRLSFNSHLAKMKENEFSLMDFILIGLIIILMIIGLATLRSVVLGTQNEQRFYRQIFWDLLSLGIMFYILFEKEIRIRVYSKYFYAISVFLLILVLFIGKTVYGARRWIDIGFFDFQPSEIFKFSVVLMLSTIFEKHRGLKAFLLSVLVVLPAGLIFLEPDLGMTILILFIWFSLIIASDVPKKYIVFVLIAGIILAPVAFFFILKDYQRARILAIFNPKEHFQYGAYNTIMSQAVIANGGLFGAGYGLGIGTNMHIVPMQYTDFIFSAFAEQFGLVGSLTLISLYAIIMITGMTRLGKYKSDFWEFVVIGVSSIFTFHVFENVGMNLGLLPVTGIPLPFISYGGTSTLIFSALIGLLIKARVISKLPRSIN